MTCLELFNVLHDAIIVGVSGRVPGDLVLTLECDYLRSLFTEPGNAFVVTLSRCTGLTFRPWSDEATVVTNPAEAAGLGLWILSAVERPDYCEVHCARRDGSQGGGLEVSAAGATLQLDTGRIIDVGEIEAVSDAYWTAFSSARKPG